MHEVEQKPGTERVFFQGPPGYRPPILFPSLFGPCRTARDRGCIIHQGDVPAHGSGVLLRSFVSISTIIVPIITTIIGRMFVRRSL